MTSHSDFVREKNSIKNLEDWLTFNKKWFDTSEWPLMTAAERSEASKLKRGAVNLGGRSWSFTFFPYALSAEARYEYVATLAETKSIRMPELKNILDNDPSLRQECPFCEIITDELGAENCPRCRRQLISVNVFD